MDHPLLFALAAIIVAVPYIIHSIRHPKKTKSQILQEQAEKKGYFCEGTRVSIRDLSYQRDNGHWQAVQEATYEYIVHDKRYKYKGTWESMMPPTSIKLYYPSGDPHKVYPEGGLPESPKTVLAPFLMLVAVAVVYWVLVYFVG